MKQAQKGYLDSKLLACLCGIIFSISSFTGYSKQALVQPKDLQIDVSKEDNSHSFNLSVSGFEYNLFDATGIIQTLGGYSLADLRTVTINSGPKGYQMLNIDFSEGNPIPTGTNPGLTFNGGADTSSIPLSHGLNLFGNQPSGSIVEEVHNASDPNHTSSPLFGTIELTDGFKVKTSILYTGLQPINDTTPASMYTFNDFGYPDQSYSATSGSSNTLVFTNTPAMGSLNFETTTIKNKGIVVFNTPYDSNTITANITANINITTASTGLVSLAFSTNPGVNNTVNFTGLPSGIPATLNATTPAGPTTLTNSDIVNITATGIPGTPTTTELTLNAVAATSTLNYNAVGAKVTVSPDATNGIYLSVPNQGQVDALGYQIINITGFTLLETKSLDKTNVNGYQIIKLGKNQVQLREIT